MTRPLIRVTVGREANRLLAHLLGELTAARESEKAEQRRHGATAEALATARRSTLGALEDYAAALEARSWPVPRTLQQEIRLHRALCELNPPGQGLTSR